MKAAVIIPPLEDFYFTDHRFSCLGAQRAAEIIESCGKIETEIIIFPLMEKKQIPLPRYLDYLEKHIVKGETGSCSFFSVFRRYGPDADKCCSLLEQIKPDYIFFSLFAYCYAEPAVELAAVLKKRMPGVILAAGGAGVSVYPGYFKPYFDAVLPGEGEISLKEYILQSVRAGYGVTADSVRKIPPGLRNCRGETVKDACINTAEYSEDRNSSDDENSTAYSEDKVFKTAPEDVREIFSENGNTEKNQKKPDILFYRDRDSSHRENEQPGENQLTGFEKERHTKEGDFCLSVSTAKSDSRSVNISALLTRGCNKKCRFCSNFITHGRDFRKTPCGQVSAELERKKELFSLHRGKKYFINFEDDNLLTDTDYFLKVAEIFISFFSEFTDPEKILLSAENGLDYNLLTTDLCGKLIDLNFRQFNFTLGSAGSDVLSGEKRSGNSRQLSELLKYINSRAVPAVSYFIAGLKNDTPEKTVDSLLFIAENPGISGISMFYSVPGLPDFSDTDFFKELPPGLLRGSSAYPWNRSLTTEQLITAFRLSRTVNLFKKNNPDQTDTALKALISKEKKLYTAVKQNKKTVFIRPPGIDGKMENLFFSNFTDLQLT